MQFIRHPQDVVIAPKSQPFTELLMPSTARVRQSVQHDFLLMIDNSHGLLHFAFSSNARRVFRPVDPLITRATKLELEPSGIPISASGDSVQYLVTSAGSVVACLTRGCFPG